MINLTKKQQIKLAYQKAFVAYLFSMGKKNHDVYEMFNEEMEHNDPILCYKHINFI